MHGLICLRCVNCGVTVPRGVLLCRASQDGLAARLDELSRLQTALRRKEADCEAVEAEIAAQIGDYQRLKQRLLQQVLQGCQRRVCGHHSLYVVHRDGGNQWSARLSNPSPARCASGEGQQPAVG